MNDRLLLLYRGCLNIVSTVFYLGAAAKLLFVTVLYLMLGSCTFLSPDDMGLIGFFFMVIYAGATGVVCSPIDFD